MKRHYIKTSFFGVALFAATLSCALPVNGTTVPSATADATTTILNADFTTSDGGFTTDNETVWKNVSNRGWQAIGRIGTQNLSIDAYLTSPEIDLTGYSDASFTFDHSAWLARNDRPSDVLHVEVLVGDKTEEVNDHVTWPESNVIDEKVNAGTISLAAYAGKKIRIQFHYTSTVVEAMAWAIKNITVTGSPSTSGIQKVEAATGLDLSKPYQIYTVDGRKATNGEKGILLYRQGSQTWKVMK